MNPRKSTRRLFPLLLAAVALAGSGVTQSEKATWVMRFADAEDRVTALDSPGILYLVDFWALGCKPCIEEMPELAHLAGEYEPSGRFRLVSVVWGGWTGKLLWDVGQKAGTGLPVYSDPENWFSRLGIVAFPTKLLIRDGAVVRRTTGGGPGAYDEWKRVIDEELRRAPNSPHP